MSFYRIYSLDGRLSLSGSLNSYNTQIDVSSLNSGMYFIEIVGDNSTGTTTKKKFTKN